MSARSRWLTAGLVAVATAGGWLLVYFEFGRPPIWVRIVMFVPLLLAVTWAQERNEEARTREMLREGPWGVRLDDPGPSEIQVIKVLRDYLDLSLADAKRIVDTAPALAATSLTEDVARRLAGDLVLQRADVTVLGPDVSP